MKGWLCILILTACTAFGAAPQHITVSGTTSDCWAGETRRTAGVEVFVLEKTAPLVNLIDGLRKATDDNVFDRYNALFNFVKASKALAHTRSDRGGSFKAEIPMVDTLIVLGYLETEDNPL